MALPPEVLAQFPPEYLTADRSSSLLIPSAVCVTLATVTLGLRIASTVIQRSKWAIDEATIILALLLTWACFSIGVEAVQAGAGKHIVVVGPIGTMNMFRMVYVFQIIYVQTPVLIKVSILLFYRRIFERARFMILNNIMIGAVLVWGFITFFLSVFQCRPIPAFWTRQVPYTCRDLQAFAVSHSVVNMTTDFIVWALPLHAIWKLHLPIGQRVGLVLIFALGLFGTFTALARLLTSLFLVNSPDPTWDLGPGFAWSIIEPSVGIMCACLPTIRPILLLCIPESWRNAFSNSFNASRKRSAAPGDESGASGSDAKHWRYEKSCGESEGLEMPEILGAGRALVEGDGEGRGLEGSRLSVEGRGGGSRR